MYAFGNEGMSDDQMMEKLVSLRRMIAQKPALLLVLALLLCGLVLLPRQGDSGMTSEEERLSRVLSCIEGAGQVRVTVYYQGRESAFSSAAQQAVGAVAVAQGAGDINVRLNLTQALMRLLDLDAQSVLVLKMQEESP